RVSTVRAQIAIGSWTHPADRQVLAIAGTARNSSQVKPRKRQDPSRASRIVVELAEGENGVVAAEPEAVPQSNVDGELAGEVGDAVEVALRVWSLVVDRRRSEVVAHREHRGGGLDCAGRAKAGARRSLA